MSARAWQRRRRNKYLRQAINQVRRNPDRVVHVGYVAVLGVNVARDLGLLAHLDKEAPE